MNGNCRQSVDGGIYYIQREYSWRGQLLNLFKVSSGGGMFSAGFCGFKTLILWIFVDYSLLIGNFERAIFADYTN